MASRLSRILRARILRARILRARILRARILRARILRARSDRDLGEIASLDYPGERLIACRNPLLAAERRRKRDILPGRGEPHTPPAS